MTDHLMPVFKDEVTKMRKPVWLADIAYCDVTMRPPIAREPRNRILPLPLIQTSFVHIPSIEQSKRDVFVIVI